MCYMISVGLPDSAHEKWIRNLPNSMRILPGRYDGLSEQMNHYSPFVVAQGVCSCRLFVSGSYEATIKKYQRKGWSQSRIERVLAEIQNNRVPFGLHIELRNWLADAATDAGDAFLFIHWDSDALDYEQKASLSTEQMRDAKVEIKAEQLIHVKA